MADLILIVHIEVTLMDLPPKLSELINDFKLIQDKNERMDMLLYYSEQFVEVPSEIASRPFADNHKVPACESQAYVWSRLNDDGAMKFYFAVENPQGISAKAMAAILDETISGELPENIVKIESDLVYDLFGRNMSMGKSAGLTSLVNIVKGHAIEAMSKKK